jgi:predicted nucleic acid-binding protein
MILYLDTSALVKRYFAELYTDEILLLWRQAAGIITSAVAYAETMAAFHRKKRDASLDEAVIRSVVNGFHMDWAGFIRVEVTADLNHHIDRLVERYPLRGFDTIHLASSILVHERLAGDLIFACFDQKLSMAAQSEGLKTFPSLPTDS